MTLLFSMTWPCEKSSGRPRKSKIFSRQAVDIGNETNFDMMSAEPSFGNRKSGWKHVSHLAPVTMASSIEAPFRAVLDEAKRMLREELAKGSEDEGKNADARGANAATRMILDSIFWFLPGRLRYKAIVTFLPFHGFLSEN